MSTAYPQLFHILPYLLAGYGIIMPIALVFYCKHLILREFPGRTMLTELQMEVSDFNGTVAALTDRFNRFQKKEDMRAARAEKTAQKDILEQAQQIMAENPPEPASTGKANLYAKARRLNS